jgi:2'-hydroxyisoflavone reductase
MRILMIGGTRFVGKHIVAAALGAGHEVTIFHRGQTGADLFPDATHVNGDRNDGFAALSEGSWDATIDTCGYVPRHVTSLADALGHRAGQYVFISSVSVYQTPVAGYDESSSLAALADPTTEDVTNDTYGGLKVLCERAALARYGPSTLIVRPTFVVGPDDFSWRFPYWVARIARGGDVLAPGPDEDPAQVIDARDMAEWIVSMVERRAGGVFHTVGPAEYITWRQLLESIAATVAPPGTTLTWVDAAMLLAADVSFPLWMAGDPDRFISAASPAAAMAAGLRLRPLADTIRDTLEWCNGQSQPTTAGPPPEREAELLTTWRDRSAG